MSEVSEPADLEGNIDTERRYETGDRTRDFTLPNAGPGPDPLTLSELDADLAIVTFLRDYYCGNSRDRARRLATQRDDFDDRNTTLLSVLPESESRTAAWVRKREDPIATLADPEGRIAALFGQPRRFGWLGRRLDLLGRQPLTVLVDLRGSSRECWRYEGATAGDWPEIDRLHREVTKFS